MKGAHLSLASLAPLWRRSCLDVRLYLLLVTLADSTGRVGTSSRPVSARALAALLSVPGGHGLAPERVTHQSVTRALLRLEGNPDLRAECPRYLSVVRSLGLRRGSIFQLEMGRGEIRLFPPAGQPAGQQRGLETRMDGRSPKLSTGQPASQPATSNNTVFISKNARETPVDKATGRARLEAMRGEFSRGSLK